jgi:ribosomal protein S18 acetylase RimI-like enzyme
MQSLSTAYLARVEDAGLNASATPRQRMLDGWLLRFSPGKAKRARCVNALSAGRLPLAEKLVLCEQAYRQAALPLIVRITPFSKPARLDETLAATAWRRFDDTRVMVLADLQVLAAASPPKVPLQAVPIDEFAQAIGALRGSPVAQREAHAERLRRASVPHRGFLAQRGGETLACGQYVVESDLVGVYDVFTAPAVRGRGIARELCRALLLRARDEGARSAYLQVDSDNDAARAAYFRLGFVDGYAYHYRTLDPEAA